MRSSEAAYRRLAALIVLLALGLRLWALHHGLPHSYYPDEAHLVKRAVKFGSGDLNPGWFHKPAFFMYVLFFEYGLYYLAGKLWGAWGSVEDFAVHFFTDRTVFYYLGRLTASLFGTALVALTLFFGRRLGGRRVGLLAGFLVAVNPCLIEAAQWVKADIPCAFFTVLAGVALLQVAAGGSWRSYAAAGAAIGLGTATKYYALALIPSVWIVHGLRPQGRGLRHPGPWLAMGSAFLAFFLASPYNILDFGTWWHLNLEPRLQEILREKLGLAGVFLGSAGGGSLGDTAANALRVLLRPDCLGPFWGGAALLGLLHQLVLRGRVAAVPFWCTLPFLALAVLWTPTGFEPRYFTAVLPFLLLGAAHLTVAVAAWLRRHHRRLVLPMWVAVAGLCVAPVSEVVATKIRRLRTDTRTLALAFVERYLPPGTALIEDHGWVKVRKNLAALERELAALRAARAEGRGGPFLGEARELQYRYCRLATRRLAAQGKPTYFVYTLNHPWWAKREDPEGDLGRDPLGQDMGTPVRRRPPTRAEMERLGIRYLITTAKTYDWYRPGERFGHFTRWVRFYAWVETLPLLYTVPYQPERRSGPTVRIYYVPPEAFRTCPQ